MPPIQYINDSQGRSTLIVMPRIEFERDYVLRVDSTNMAAIPESLLSADGRTITLPHGGLGAKIDVHALAHAFCRRGTVLTVLPIAKKQQKLADFGSGPDGPINGLDAMLRRCCLPKESPYRDTMQATTAVVDALVETGLFERAVRSLPGFYRPVQCLVVNEEKMITFVNELGDPAPENRIDPHDLIVS